MGFGNKLFCIAQGLITFEKLAYLRNCHDGLRFGAPGVIKPITLLCSSLTNVRSFDLATKSFSIKSKGLRRGPAPDSRNHQGSKFLLYQLTFDLTTFCPIGLSLLLALIRIALGIFQYCAVRKNHHNG